MCLILFRAKMRANDWYWSHRDAIVDDGEHLAANGHRIGSTSAAGRAQSVRHHAQMADDADQDDTNKTSNIFMKL